MVLVQYILAVSFTFPNRNLEHSETWFRLCNLDTSLRRKSMYLHISAKSNWVQTDTLTRETEAKVNQAAMMSFQPIGNIVNQ